QSQPTLTGAVQDHALVAGFALLVGGVQVEARVPGDRRGERQPPAAVVELRPAGDRTLAERQRRVADEQVRVRPALEAEALARRAPPERAVERVVVRVQGLEAQVAPLARQVLRELLDL